MIHSHGHANAHPRRPRDTPSLCAGVSSRIDAPLACCMVQVGANSGGNRRPKDVTNPVPKTQNCHPPTAHTQPPTIPQGQASDGRAARMQSRAGMRMRRGTPTEVSESAALLFESVTRGVSPSPSATGGLGTMEVVGTMVDCRTRSSPGRRARHEEQRCLRWFGWVRSVCVVWACVYFCLPQIRVEAAPSPPKVCEGRGTTWPVPTARTKSLA